MARKSTTRRRTPTVRILGSTGRTPLQMALANLANAERCLSMLGGDCGDMIPHPSVIVAAEIRNAMRHIELINVDSVARVA